MINFFQSTKIRVIMSDNNTTNVENNEVESPIRSLRKRKRGLQNSHCSRIPFEMGLLKFISV